MNSIKYLAFVLLVGQSLLFPQGGADSVEGISLDSLLNIKISSASKYLETSKEAPSSVSIITAEDIEKFGYRTFPEILNSIRDFYLSYDRNYTYLGVRGFSRPTDYNDRVLLTINGHSVNDFYYGQAPLGTDFILPLSSIERVEIIRGPGSVIYGNNAMFAVINVVTKNGSTSDVVSVSAEAGSAGLLKSSFTIGNEVTKDFNFFVAGMIADTKGRDIYYQEFDSPSTNHGVAQNLDWDRYYGIYASASFKQFNLHGLLGSREKGVPTASYGNIFNDPSAKTIDTRGFLELKYDQDLSSDKNISARGYFDSYGYKGDYPGLVMSHDSNDVFGLGAEGVFRWDISALNRFVSGIEIRSITESVYANYYEDKIATYNNHKANILSVYAQDEAQITDNLLLNFGIRLDKQTDFKGIFAPRLAVVYSPFKQTTLKYIYGEAFRYPNSYELFYEDALSRFKLSSGLKEERIISNEFLVETKFNEYFHGTVDVYANNVRNLIDQIMEPSDSSLQFRNVGKVMVYGFGVECNMILNNGVSGYLRYSYQNAKDPDLDIQLSNSPDNMVKLGFAFPFLNYFKFASEFFYETGRLTVYNTKTKPVYLVNSNISTKIINNSLRMSLSVTNLLNKTYFYPGGYEHVQNAIAQDPRSFDLKITYEF